MAWRKRTLTKALITLVCTAPLLGQTKLLRFPDIHGDLVVFCYAGDIWRVSDKGGVAARLTAHPGQELFPKISPDGEWLAFTGQYDGDEQVYVMPIRGGIPRRLTYYPAQGPLAPRWGYDNQVYGWTPDGKKIVFRSLRDADGGRTLTALYTISVQGGLPEKLPMPTSGAGDFSPNGRHLIYSPLFRDFRTWKRYQGGWAQDLYIFDLENNQTRKVAPSKWTERDPMWIQDRIYFVSDRDGRLNLYSQPVQGDQVEQETRHETWDVRWASSDNQSRIVYELKGELQVYDTESKNSTRLDIFVPNDGVAMRPTRYSASKNVEDYELSPKAKRALFVGRGDIFTLPIEKGATRNLTNSSDSHEKHARWSPDGRSIAFVSDQTGEEQIYVIDQSGNSPAQQLTTQFSAMLHAPEWSPDSKRLAFSDKDGRLYVLNLESRSVEEIADDEFGSIRDYAWSPDSAHLAFSMADLTGFRSLYIWSAGTDQVHRATGELYNDFGPSWDPNGKYLYFLSDREFAPLISSVEWNFAGNRNARILALALTKNVPHPFPPESDEVETDEKDKESDESKAASTSGETPEREADSTTEIDFDELEARISTIPVEAQNIGELVATSEYLIYRTSGAAYYGRTPEDKPALNLFDFKKRKSGVLAEGVSGFAVSGDGSKILVRHEGSYRLYPTKLGNDEAKTVSMQNMWLDRVPAKEWEQIFDEVWRRYRDFFYVRNMHGFDWEGIGNRYRALLPHVAHRSDLNYLIGEMIAELNVGHAYIEGGDFEIPERPHVGLPGARFELDPQSNRYRISKIFKGSNSESKYRAPLAEVGINLEGNEYVLAIDGKELLGTDNPYRMLLHKTNPVRLTVNSSPSPEGGRDIEYTPISSESSLLYLDWVEGNKQKVDQLTQGRVGYLHLPNMGGAGIYEFIKWFYPQIRKEGMVIDVRSNGGGNVSQWIIERLDSTLLGTRFGYSSDQPGTYPATVFHGHMVCLINQTSASDGDIFPYRFRQAGLGPLIGKRTWGGVVGISSRGPLIDGGTVYVPLSGTNAADGSWIIEGEGVLPDIEVENEPSAVLAGADPQLERGVQEILRMISANPKRLPSRPPDPVKAR